MPIDAGRRARGYAAGLGILGLCALGAPAEQPGPHEPAVLNENDAAVRTPEAVIRKWPDRPRATAGALIAKYGEPSSFDDDSLVWYNKGPWRQTVVYREAPHSFMGYHGKDILEQWISYVVPENRIAELKRFDNRIAVDKAGGELSARSESENLNYLALNLADEILAGKRRPDAARDFYLKTMKLSASGKSSPYMDGFLFPPRAAPRE